MLSEKCLARASEWMFSDAYAEVDDDTATEQETELLSVLDNTFGNVGPFESDLAVLIEIALSTILPVEVIIAE
jgi:hypothetical protein